MAAPLFIPLPADRALQSYVSSRSRRGSWAVHRPGDFEGRQPLDDRLGTPGPDPGYALTLAERFRDQLKLPQGISADDAIAGSVSVALKRSGYYGRAPILADVQMGLERWGFLTGSEGGVGVDASMVDLRAELFPNCHHPYHWEQLRAIADAIPIESLR